MARHGAALDLHKIHIESDVDTGPTTKTGVAGLGSASAAPGRSGTIAWICQCHQTRGHGYPDSGPMLGRCPSIGPPSGAVRLRLI